MQIKIDKGEKIDEKKEELKKRHVDLVYVDEDWENYQIDDIDIGLEDITP